jgi:dTDP-4-amino-4,6-dideoxygalactose transaminase
VVCKLDESQFGLSRNTLIAILKAENVIARRYFYPGLHRTIPYAQEYPQYLNQLPHTDRLCETSIQLPIGALVTGQSVEKICRIIRNAQLAAAEIAGVYEK